MGQWSRWGSEGPPPQAYSRVTNPQRFQPLHDLALQLIEGLEATYQTQRVEGCDIDPEIEGLLKGSVGLARPTVKLVPQDTEAAPLTIAFSGFPGIKVRAGYWYLEPFPGCGCDACDETLDSESTQLRRLAEDVTSGRFREAIHLPDAGDGWQEAWLWSTQGSSRRRGRLERALAIQRAAEAGRWTIDWQPWPVRDQTEPADAP